MPMSNRLAAESSPYLRQHAGNPVHWWPWCDAALDEARRLDRPILLSIGYSACHWCHVMAHESFEDPATAEVMNTLFVNIKVDREERPDLDRVYQLAHQALTRRGGGWPLTVFLTPDDLMPFFAGTYFPKTPRYGMPGFVQVLRQVRDGYDRQREQIRTQNAALAEFLTGLAQGAGDLAAALTPKPVQAALAELERRFDREWGGFGSAPKFPHCAELALLFEIGDRRPESAPHWRHLVLHSLRRMAEGGIHDQLSGGFCRYSVDARWEIPHFEKMLYDNAQLLPLYARAAAETGEAVFVEAADGIGHWLEREMRAPDDGHFSALDADSDDGRGQSHEGAFYLWSREQVSALLSQDDYALAAARFGFDRPANFEDRAWNPIQAAEVDALAERFGQSPARILTRLDSIRRTLFGARARRPRPGLDDKRLTAWNALLASGYARAAGWLNRPDWGSRAQAIVHFLRAKVWVDGRLRASHQGGVARFEACLEDHAFLLEALLDTLALTPEPRWLEWAVELAGHLLERFEDRGHGGFFHTAHDHETLIVRLRPVTDEALPSGNGVAARALLRLGHLLGEARFVDAAERALRAAGPDLENLPQACATMVSALAEHLDPSRQVVVRLPAAGADPWLERGRTLGARGTRLVLLPADAAVLPQYPAKPSGVAYVCIGTRCLAPATSVSELDARLEESATTTVPDGPR